MCLFNILPVPADCLGRYDDRQVRDLSPTDFPPFTSSGRPRPRRWVTTVATPAQTASTAGDYAACGRSRELPLPHGLGDPHEVPR
jgi:hypothetical protein